MKRQLCARIAEQKTINHRMQRISFAWNIILDFLKFNEQYHLVWKCWSKKHLFCKSVKTFPENVLHLVQYSQLTTLDLYSLDVEDDVDLMSLTLEMKNVLKSLVGLTYLCIGNVQRIDLSGLIKCQDLMVINTDFVLFPPNLQSLVMISSKGVTIMWAMDLQHLRHLSLCNVEDLKEQDLGYLRFFPSLCELTLEKYENFVDETPWTIDLRECLCLTTLEIDGYPLKKVYLPTSLRSFEITMHEDTSPNIFDFFCETHDLQILKILQWEERFRLTTINQVFTKLKELDIQSSSMQKNIDARQETQGWMNSLMLGD